MIRFCLTFLFVFCFLVSRAMAADPFTVVNVHVDARGQNAIEAQTYAISQGQYEAAKILIDRLTLPSERAKSPMANLTPESAAKMIRALEISNEKRSGQRYLGDVTIAFNPRSVQEYFRAQGLSMMSTQSRNRLVLPVMGMAPIWSDNMWTQAWKTTRFEHSLTPVMAYDARLGRSAMISASEAAAIDMSALRQVGQRLGVDQILVAELIGSSGTSAKVTDVTLDTGQRQSYGTVSADSPQALAAKIVSRVENDWKTSSVTNAENAVSKVFTVLYKSQNEWMNLQEVINNSAQIQGARLDAISKDGALMTLTYGGDMDRLKRELSFKGVDVVNHPRLGLVLARAGRL